MSSKKTARYYAEPNSKIQNSTTSLFIRNHTSPDQLLSQVQVLFAQGHTLEAGHVVECILDHYNPLISSSDLFSLHAKVFIELQGFNVHAQCAIQQALMLDPAHEESLALQELANLHEELRDGLYESAETALRELIAKEPKNIYARFILGSHLFWKNGREEEVIELLEGAVKTRPSFLKAWQCLAMAYKKSQAFEKAEMAFQECLALDTDSQNQDFYTKHLQSL